MKTVWSDTVGKATLRIVQKDKGYTGVMIVDGKVVLTLADSDMVTLRQELLDRAGESDPSYFGYDGARARFLAHFPGGFGSEDFIAAERAYKLAARAKLKATLPLEQAIDGSGMGAAALAAFQATNLLSAFEKARLAPLLKGSDGDAFVRAAAQFTLGEHAQALATLERLARPHDSAKWTVVTYLPFLWAPEDYLFLKPQVTQDYAARVGHRFARDYDTALDPDVYASLLDLADRTRVQVSDLNPRDNIDIQSFIWIVGAYGNADIPAGT